MVQQVSKGIKISVESEFRGRFQQDSQSYFAFAYTIRITNQGNRPVQLISRYWKICDVLSYTEMVEGDGVVGQQPLLEPGESHIYTSGCYLKGPMGSMQGHYRMISTEGKETFKVGIPRFQLHAGFAMN